MKPIFRSKNAYHVNSSHHLFASTCPLSIHGYTSLPAFARSVCLLHAVRVWCILKVCTSTIPSHQTEQRHLSCIRFQSKPLLRHCRRRWPPKTWQYYWFTIYTAH